MLTLGIETSCDDTAVSVTKDGNLVLSSVLSTQDDIHSLYGGIVPELASRAHMELITSLTDKALSTADVDLKDISLISVTNGPGLVGSILIGLSFAKGLSYANNIPFTHVNHIEGHALSGFLKEAGDDDKLPSFPYIALIVSGGHTSLIKVISYNDFTLIGATRDDAAGEAYDKTAKLLGFTYPGGVKIDRLAQVGDAKAFHFKRTLLDKTSLEFSFSGIKTAVLTYVKKENNNLSDTFKKDISASFQECITDVLKEKARRALEQENIKDLVIAGGVASNSLLRVKLKALAEDEGLNLFIPNPKFCTDNAAMIALRGFHAYKKGILGTLETNANSVLGGY